MVDEYGRITTTAERLKQIMEERGLSQTDLAEGSGVERTRINRYVLDKAIPKSDKIMKLAKFLNVSEMWLWGFDVPKERNASKERNMRAAQITTRMRNDEEFLLLVEQLNALPADQLNLIKGIVRGFVGNKDTKDEV